MASHVGPRLLRTFSSSYDTGMIDTVQTTAIQDDINVTRRYL